MLDGKQADMWYGEETRMMVFLSRMVHTFTVCQ